MKHQDLIEKQRRQLERGRKLLTKTRLSIFRTNLILKRLGGGKK